MARYSNPIIQYSDGNGVPLPGATLDFFEPGTTTRKNTFEDSGLTTANSNPVVADSAGVMPDIWLDGTYAVVLKNAGGVVQPEGTKDPIGETTEGQWEAWLNDNTYNIPDLVKGSDNKFYRSLTDANQGNDPTSSASDWEEIEFERIYNATVTYALGDRSIGSDGMQYFSLIAANLNNNPVTDTTSTNWRAADQTRSAPAAGTADELTATFIPAVAAYKNGLEVRVRALLANTTTTPTINYNGLGDKTIVKNGNQALSIADIAGLGHELQLVYNSTNDNVELLNPAASSGSLSVDSLFHIQNQQTSGTNGGTFTNGAWRTRQLTVEVTNNISGASLSVDQITLPAGDYYAEMSAIASDVGEHKIKLANITDVSDIIIGDTAAIRSNNSTHSFAYGLFTIADTKVLELQHISVNTRATDGFGRAGSFGVVEIYCDVKIWKV